jgi:hypothetical protein
MASKASMTKTMVSVKLPNRNYQFLEDIIKNEGGSVAGYINEAVSDWLAARGLEPEISTDGRIGRWRRVKDVSDTGSQ